jgi:hypothetical protein
MAMSRINQVGIASDHFRSECRKGRFSVAAVRWAAGVSRGRRGPVRERRPTSWVNGRGRRASSMDDFRMLKAFSRRQAPQAAIKLKGRILFVNLAEVRAVEAEGNYVLLRQESTSYLLREAISVLAEKLEPYGFVRIHRSVLVNASFVEAIEPRSNGDYGLRTRGGTEYTVTRTYRKNLGLLATVWIGTPPVGSGYPESPLGPPKLRSASGGREAGHVQARDSDSPGMGQFLRHLR